MLGSKRISHEEFKVYLLFWVKNLSSGSFFWYHWASNCYYCSWSGYEGIFLLLHLKQYFCWLTFCLMTVQQLPWNSIPSFLTDLALWRSQYSLRTLFNLFILTLIPWKISFWFFSLKMWKCFNIFPFSHHIWPILSYSLLYLLSFSWTYIPLLHWQIYVVVGKHKPITPYRFDIDLAPHR